MLIAFHALSEPTSCRTSSVPTCKLYLCSSTAAASMTSLSNWLDTLATSRSPQSLGVGLNNAQELGLFHKMLQHDQMNILK